MLNSLSFSFMSSTIALVLFDISFDITYVWEPLGENSYKAREGIGAEQITLMNMLFRKAEVVDEYPNLICFENY